MKTINSKEKPGIGWLTLKIALKILKVLFSRVGLYFFYLSVFMAVLLSSMQWKPNLDTVVFLSFSVFICSLLFELAYALYLKSKIKETHRLIDYVIEQISNNFR
ncbi:MAG: hypothetical protein WC466_09145 [Candidatus Izemoplasmatales bacterium]